MKDLDSDKITITHWNIWLFWK